MGAKMDSVATFQKRVQDELAAVENEINGYNQQIEALNKRLEGLKRARELFESDPAAITELLRSSTPAENGTSNKQELATPSTAARTPQTRNTSPKLTATAGRAKAYQPLNAREHKAAQAHLTQVREANSNGKVKRTDLIAAVLQGTPEKTIEEIIMVLNKEFGWKSTESNLTGHLYTNPKMFTHTKADRSGKTPIRWSLK
jgi:predicted  nucleic acid-binding Zn-ribbon protein